MGFAKRLMEEYESREFGEVPDRYICNKCVGDYGLQEYIRRNATRRRCSYCKRKSKRNSAISLEKFILYVQKCLRAEYETAEDSGTPYETREGGWLGEVLDIWEVLDEHPIYSDEGEIEADVQALLEDNTYAKNFTGTPADWHSEYWGRFVDLVKYKARFILFRKDFTFEYDFDDPRYILDTIGELLPELVKTVPPRQQLTRVRVSQRGIGGMWAANLGTNSPRHTKQASRMSPAGIPLFYAAESLSTAIAEVSPSESDKLCHIGTFETSSDALLIDFTAVPLMPSIYDEYLADKREAILFLRRFVKDMALPVEKNGEGNIDYLPTQIVTEYIRYLFKVDGKNVNGIRYPSTQHEGGVCYAFFVDSAHCLNAYNKIKDDEKLNLILTDAYTRTTASVLHELAT